MSSYYQDLDRGYFDYDLHPVPGIPNALFRGPQFDPSRSYVACIGAAQTFGRFCAQSFPSILGDRFGFQFLNLGIGGVGPRFFDSPAFLDKMNAAKFVVVQVLSGRSEGNSLFDTSETGSLLGVRLKDNKRMRFEDFLSELLNEAAPDIIRRVVSETRENYVRNTINLLKKIHRPKILFWFSNRSPEYNENLSNVWELLGEFPQLVNRTMLDKIRAYADASVECVSTSGIPQMLWDAEERIDGAWIEHGKLVNRYYPSPQMHEEAADALEPICRRFLSRASAGESTFENMVSAGDQATRFIIVAGARTGSNLLRGLLNSNPECLVGSELFNQYYFDHGYIPLYYESSADERAKINFDPELMELRSVDPIKFVERFFDITAGWGYCAIGFKMMYYDLFKYEVVSDYLAKETNIHVIHLKRRNLLRRYLSWRRAEITKVWELPPDTPTSLAPPVALPLMDCVADFERIKENEKKYDECFKNHQVLEIFYEDLEKDPQTVGARALAFVGLKCPESLNIRYQKTGTTSLREGIENYDELKAAFLRWASYFDE